MSDKKFVPDWTNTPPVPGSYRSIVKEGRQDQVEVPSYKYFRQLQKDLQLGRRLLQEQTGRQPAAWIRSRHPTWTDVSSKKSLPLSARKMSRWMITTG